LCPTLWLRSVYDSRGDSKNILEQAISNNELDKFLVGESPYFVESRNDNEEPQNVAQAFDQLVLPYWRHSSDKNFPERLFSKLADLLVTYSDKNRAIYVAHDWIWYYLYCRAKKSSHPDGYYSDLFDFDITPLTSLLKAVVENNKQNLIEDKRWAGAPWNSKDGMWGALLRISLAIRDQLGGPDFVPANT
jgi:hypothetical protein